MGTTWSHASWQHGGPLRLASDNCGVRVGGGLGPLLHGHLERSCRPGTVASSRLTCWAQQMTAWPRNWNAARWSAVLQRVPASSADADGRGGSDLTRQHAFRRCSSVRLHTATSAGFRSHGAPGTARLRLCPSTADRGIRHTVRGIGDMHCRRRRQAVRSPQRAEGPSPGSGWSSSSVLSRSRSPSSRSRATSSIPSSSHDPRLN